MSHQSFSRTWDTTRLWLELKRRDLEAEEIRSVLAVYLPEISRILHDAVTGIEDFTLHDEGHAWRVAERMVDILPTNLLQKLSPVELALLLLSAYLHDIGMSPGRARVVAFRTYLLSGNWEAEVVEGMAESPVLPTREKEEFDAWLIEHTSIEPGKSNGPVLSYSFLAELDHAIAHFCRNRHVAWGEQWIRQFMSSLPRIYAGWTDDLIRLCSSHHEGYEELKQDDFNPRPVPRSNEFVHLRFLACVLRVADVIEFDPERTPDVIFHHRGISPSSRIFWWKDQEISWIIDYQGRLTIAARPPDAKIHRAVEETIADVERELRLCRRLADDRAFSDYGGSHVLPHRWHLGVAVHQDVQPRHGSYQYIDGSFRPNTKKVLELLGGLALYGDRHAAIRELLQNAFDAVREQTAHQLLLQPEGRHIELQQLVQKTHFVNLQLHATLHGISLTCTDSGAGMSKEIIEKFFLMSGESRRPDIDRLRRRCETKGIDLLRSGQFGIGILSYFLLASRIVLKTRRSSEAGDTDGTGWLFETEGIGTFGELRRDASWLKGTQLQFHLRDDLHHDLVNLSRYISLFLRDQLCYLPCVFRFESTVTPEDSFIKEPGWTLEKSDLEELVTGGISSSDRPLEGASGLEPLVPNKLQLERLQIDREIVTLKAGIQQHMRWLTLEEEIPEPRALVRIHIPVFEIDGDVSLAYFHRSAERDGFSRFLDSEAYLPEGSLRTSWRGFKADISVSRRFMRFGVVEIDFRSMESGSISARRREFALTEAGAVIIEKVKSLRGRLTDHESFKHGKFAYINSLIIDQFTEDSPPHLFSMHDQPNWINRGAEKTSFAFRPISLPAIRFEDLLLRSADVEYARLARQELDILSDISLSRGTRRGPTLSPFPVRNIPNFFAPRVALATEVTSDLFCELVWQTPRNITTFPDLMLGEFPPNWESVLACRVEKRFIFNQDSPISLHARLALISWVSMHPDPRPVSSDMLSDRSKAATWITFHLATEHFGFEYRTSIQTRWMALIEQQPTFVNDWLGLILPNRPAESRYIAFVESIYSRTSVLVLSAKQAQTLPLQEAFEKILAKPSRDWFLEVKWQFPKKRPA